MAYLPIEDNPACLAFATLNRFIVFLEGQRTDVGEIASNAEFRDDIREEEFRVTSGYIDIDVPIIKKTVEKGLEIIAKLYFI